MARFPAWLLVLVVVPTFAGTLALIAATRVLARAQDGSGPIDYEPFRLGPVLRVGLLSAALATAAFFIPYLGVLLIVLMLPLLFGPPIVAQVVATQGSPVGSAVREARHMLAGRTQRVVLYLINVAAGLGLLSMILVGGGEVLALRNGEPALTILGALYKAVILGALSGFLACVEFVIYADLRARSSAATPD